MTKRVTIGTPLPDAEIRKFAEAIRKAVEAGHFEPGTNPGAGRTTALRIVQRELGLTKNQADVRLRLARKAGLDALWATEAKPKEAPTIDDSVRERRLERELAGLKAERTRLLDRVIAAEDLRATVFDLAAAIEAPATIVPKSGGGHGGRRSAILHISDVHAGEAVDIYEMDGLNAYDLSICRARLERLFQKTASLLTDHWKGDPVEDLVICLGGDMIDNNLREESRRGGASPVVVSMKAVSEMIAGGIAFLRQSVGAPVRVYTSPGNHGRLTPKPHSAEGNIDNLDMVVSWGVEKMLVADPGVRFFYTGSGEALFNVYGWKFLLQHGHEGAGGHGRALRRGLQAGARHVPRAPVLWPARPTISFCAAGARSYERQDPLRLRQRLGRRLQPLCHAQAKGRPGAGLAEPPRRRGEARRHLLSGAVSWSTGGRVALCPAGDRPCGRGGMSPLIIGLTGLRGVGKTTAADHLVARHGFRRIHSFRGGKEAAKGYFRHLGASEADACRMVDGDLRDQTSPLLPGYATPRFFLEKLGRFMGDTLGPDWTLGREIEAALREDPERPIVVESVVYEAEVIRRHGGFIVRIVRPGASGPKGAESDAAQGAIDAHFVVINDRKELAFTEKIDALMQAVLSRVMQL